MNSYLTPLSILYKMLRSKYSLFISRVFCYRVNIAYWFTELFVPQLTISHRKENVQVYAKNLNSKVWLKYTPSL